jgi:hypothetical protein
MHKSYETAKSLKNDDAKLQGLKQSNAKPASFRIRTLRFMKIIGGIYVMKLSLKLKYSWHFLRYRYIAILKNDCLCKDLKVKLEQKANFHEKKAVSLLLRM